MSASKKSIKASTLRIILASGLAAILLAMAGGFYLAYNSLKQTAQETADVQAEAKSSDNRLVQLQNTQLELEKNKKIVKKAEQVVAESQSYQYQNQIINDLTRYASQAGLGVESFTFQNSESGGGAAASPTQPAAPTGAAGGVKSVTVNVQLSGNLNYQSILKFLHLVEQNLTRMQVTSVSLSKDDASNQGANPATQTFSIEVFVK